MNRFCRIVLAIFAVLYLLALGLLLIGTFGLFGSERDPLAGVFLMPLGLPWNLMLDGFPEPALPWIAALSPLMNLLIIGVIRRMTAGWAFLPAPSLCRRLAWHPTTGSNSHASCCVATPPRLCSERNCDAE